MKRLDTTLSLSSSQSSQAVHSSKEAICIDANGHTILCVRKREEDESDGIVIEERDIGEREVPDWTFLQHSDAGKSIASSVGLSLLMGAVAGVGVLGIA